MRSFPRPGAATPPRAASRPAVGSVSPAALRIAQEADATMSPDGWEANYAGPSLPAEAPATTSVATLAGTLPVAR